MATLANQLRQTPAQVIGIDPDDEVTTYSVNHAVLTFYNALQERIRLVTKGEKKEENARKRARMEIERWLTSDKAPEERFKGRFADPMKSTKLNIQKQP